MAYPENRRKAQRSVDEVVDAMPSFTKGTSRFSRSQVAPAGVPEAGDNTSMETLTEQMIADFEAAFRLFDEDGSGAHKSPPTGTQLQLARCAGESTPGVTADICISSPSHRQYFPIGAQGGLPDAWTRSIGRRSRIIHEGGGQGWQRLDRSP